jgi:hypothetical protein
MDNARKSNKCIDPGFFLGGGGRGRCSSTVIKHLFVHSFMVPYTASDLDGFFVMFGTTENEHRFGSPNKEVPVAGSCEHVWNFGFRESRRFLTGQLLAYQEVPCSM